MLVGIGTGAVVASARVGGIPQWLMAVAWFLAVLLPVLLFVRISGAHLNPAVTLGLAASRRTPASEVPLYVLAQLSGALLGSALVLFTLGRFAHLGATIPKGVSVSEAIVAELLFTGLLMASVFLLTDRGEGWARWRLLLPPAAVGLSTFFIGPITGSSLNPARSIAPAVLSGTYSDLWLYLVATPLAAFIVALIWGRGVPRSLPAAGSMPPSRPPADPPGLERNQV
jgi:glycerol uptake facilitator-like aquaporin